MQCNENKFIFTFIHAYLTYTRENQNGERTIFRFTENDRI